MRSTEPLTNIVAIVGTLAAMSCSHRTQDPAPSKANTLQRGDRVLVESNAAHFYEARVLSVENSKLRVQALPSGDAALVQVADVYRLPSRGTTMLPAALAICTDLSERWFGCRITKSGSDGAEAIDVNELTHKIAWNQIMPPSPLTELNLKRLFDKAGEQHDFEHELEHAGLPKTLPGWRPFPGKAVLAKVDGKWWKSVIVSEKHGKVRVKFVGSDRHLEVDRIDIAPEPPFPMEISQKSRFALVRPSNPNQPWSPVRLISVDNLEAVVEGLGAKRRTVPVRDVCPLESSVPARNP